MDMDNSPAEQDKKAVEKFNRQLIESLKREEKLNRHYEWRGNKLPPFSIEPMPYERQRLATPMTAEERAARRQWVVDQELAPHEPVYIKELYPRNIIRRVYGAPMNFLCNKLLKPVVGKKYVADCRYLLPRFLWTVGFMYFSWYHLKYHQHNWEGWHGWFVMKGQPQVLPGDPGWPNPALKDDFYDRGFKDRKVLLD